MGTLTPGSTLIYERVGGVIYARESGKNERVVIGYDGTSIQLMNFLNQNGMQF